MSEDKIIVNEIEEQYEVKELTEEIIQEETVEVVDIDDNKIVEIDTQEAFASLGDTNDMSVHSNLHGRDERNQHPISAISGLRSELNSLNTKKTPQVVYSDKKDSADYYEWSDGNPLNDRVGYFVTLLNDARTIEICTDNNIFGVTVDTAAFIGGQDKIARDYRYGLVASSGVANVRCESDVLEGDCVVSNSSGMAKKTIVDYGYRVISTNIIDGVSYATISLDIHADQINTIGAGLLGINNRIDDAEINISKAINVANDAYKKASECIISNEEIGNQVNNAVGRVEDMESDVKDIETKVENSMSISVQAKAIAESASVSAESIKNEAVKIANEALDTAGKIEQMVEPINKWEYTDPVTGETNTGAEYFAEYVKNGLSTKAEMETVSKLDEENKLLIEKNAESYNQMLSSIDKYSVGEYSQSYGLTLEQAGNILKEGMVYIPTKHDGVNTHVEEYPFGEEGLLKREFTHGFYYVWAMLQDGTCMWSEAVGEVWFGEEQPAGTAYAYWYDGDKLYILNGNQWREVATLAGNVNNRITSMIHQTANEVALEVANARGSAATLDVRIDNTESAVQSIAAWTKDENGKPYNLATIKQTADDAGASVALVVQEKDGEKVINSASIVTAINDDTSSVGINADRITMTGTTTFLKPEDVGEDGTTVISGSRITTGEIDAKKVKVTNLQASSIIVTGNETVDEALSKTLVSSTIYYALSASPKTPPEDDLWSKEAPERERKKYMWQKTVNVYGDGSSEERVVCIAGADGEGAIIVDITSSAGTIYINNDIKTTLVAKAYQDNQDITDEFPDSAFLWEKYDMYGTKDTVWSYTGKTIAVNNLDIYKRAMFNCILDVEQRIEKEDIE